MSGLSKTGLPPRRAMYPYCKVCGAPVVLPIEHSQVCPGGQEIVEQILGDLRDV